MDSLACMPDFYDFAVSRVDMRDTRVLESEGPELDLGDGQVLIEVDHFSLTANNVTYGAMGEAMNYWDFYPAPDGLGRIPAWGYGDVVASRADGIETGARVFGYLPMSTHAVLEPGRIRDAGFTDVTAHRAALPALGAVDVGSGHGGDERSGVGLAPSPRAGHRGRPVRRGSRRRVGGAVGVC